MAQKHILIICGEASGDLNAANLTQNILALNPKIKISATGGMFLRSAGAEIFADIKGLAVIGLFDVLKKLPKFFALKKLILKKIETEKPDAVILVDFSGFNLRLARAINKRVPVIYYISPQVWASRPGRIKTIKEYIDKIIVIFKFEQEFYKKYGIAADFVGHPLLDIVAPTMDKNAFLHECGLSETKTTIALLPGSRAAEIENILPVMLKACSIMAGKIKNIQFIIAKSPNVNSRLYQRRIKGINLDLKTIENKTYDCLNIADFCMVASGTATLETAVMQKPFIVIYRMNILNYLLYRPQVKIPYICMANIVAGKKIVPEFIQFQATPQKIAEAGLKIIGNPQEKERMRAELAQVKSSLGQTGAAGRAAQIILDFLTK